MRMFTRLRRMLSGGQKTIPVEHHRRLSGPGTEFAGDRPLSKQAERPQGTEWAEACERMLASDGKLAGAAMQLKNNLLDAKWTVVEGASHSPIAARNADLIREAFGLDGHQCHLASGSFESELRKVVSYPLLGYHVVEEVWATDSRGMRWLAELGDIDPASIDRWVRDPATGMLQSIQQRPIYAPGPMPEPLPSTKALVFTLSRVGDDYEGTGLLSPCWYWWDLKQRLQEALVAGVKRMGTPIPQLAIDRAALNDEGYTLSEQSSLIGVGQQYLEAYTRGEADYITIPAGFSLTTFGGADFNVGGLIEAIDHANREMASAFLANFQEMGLTDVGSRSIGEIHWHSYKSSIANYLDIIADTFNGPCRPGGGTLARLLQLNFYGEGVEVPAEDMPRLAHRGVEVTALGDMLTMLPQLVTGGLITPTDDLEAAIRREMRLDSPVPVRSWRDRLPAAGGAPIPEQENVGGRPSQKGVE